jgi:putative ABC transport system permease protein
MEQALSQSVADRRVYVVLLTVFAVIALLMATSVSTARSLTQRRTQEIGIRVAVGANVGKILVMVIRQSMLLTLIGAGIGIAGSFALTTVISGLHFGITPYDALLSSGWHCCSPRSRSLRLYIPARRAATIDPTVAFRCE